MYEVSVLISEDNEVRHDLKYWVQVHPLIKIKHLSQVCRIDGKIITTILHKGHVKPPDPVKPKKPKRKINTVKPSNA